MTLSGQVISGILIGAGLGMFYFGGLWFSVKSLCGAARPFRWMFVSYVIRMTAVAGIFSVLVVNRLWISMVITFVVFLLARQIMIWPARKGVSKERLK